jgi:tyrosyl-tRNA synthetase
MRNNIYQILKGRGFVEQVTDERAVCDMLEKSITCYIGFDPTASSLHVGHLLPLMALAHLQRHGHRPIILLGGGTALIGDPSGKNEMRQILSREAINENAEKVKEQFLKYLSVECDKGAIVLNNADWLTLIKYIEFLRDIGKHFSVNRMIAAESYKMRLETGLSFIEFNYMLLQAFDYLHLFQNHQCVLQMGGNDQWGNILAGIDLVRKVTGATVYGLTFPLLTTSSGAKMGKTEKGAVWLDHHRTSPYEFYQYWMGTDDRDVEKFLSIFTFLPLDEIAGIVNGEQGSMQKAREILSFEVTAITHGKTEALRAKQSARSVFYGDGTDLDSLPTTVVGRERLNDGIPAFILFKESNLCSTRSEARRLISEGGAYVSGVRLKVFDEIINESYIRDDILLLRAGKKRYHKIVFKNSKK